MPPSAPLLNVVLYAPRIPHNTGQIARTCFAMGLQLHLIRPLGFRIDAAALRRAAVGHWQEIRPIIHADGSAFWGQVPELGRVHLISKVGRRAYTEADFESGDWIVFGNEDEGLPNEWLQAHGERSLRIPMRNPEARCLNLATAASVVIFEAVRQLGVSEGPPASSAP